MRLLTGIVLLLLLPGITAAFVWNVVILTHATTIFAPFCLGVALGILLDHFAFHRMPVVETFEHELTHAVAALMFFRRVTGFVVKRKGGTVSYQEGFGGRLANDFIGLAPYILPLFTALSVVGRFFVPATWFPWYDGWIGLTFGYHIWSSIEETGGAWTKRKFVSAGTGEVTQTDIARRGFIYSAIFIAAFSLAIHGALIAVLVKGTGGLAGWAQHIWNVTVMVTVALVAHGKRLALLAWSAFK
jgi:hypothetical protein